MKKPFTVPWPLSLEAIAVVLLIILLLGCGCEQQPQQPATPVARPRIEVEDYGGDGWERTWTVFRDNKTGVKYLSLRGGAVIDLDRTNISQLRVLEKP